jgi:hypothetical protein
LTLAAFATARADMPENPDTISRFSAASIILPAVSHIGWAFVVETIVPAIFDLTIDVAMQPVPNTPPPSAKISPEKDATRGALTRFQYDSSFIK